MAAVRRSIVAATATMAVCGGLAIPASASAASVALCVPSTAGATVTAAGGGSCSGGATKVALPASSADQQTLLNVLPFISFNASGVGGKPTIRFTGANVQIVSGSGSTSGTVNGEGNLIV